MEMSPITSAMGQSNIRGNELLCWTAHKSQPMWGEYLLSIYSNRRDTSQCWIPISSTSNRNTNAGPRSTLLSLRFSLTWLKRYYSVVILVLVACSIIFMGIWNMVQVHSIRTMYLWLVFHFAAPNCILSIKRKKIQKPDPY